MCPVAGCAARFNNKIRHLTTVHKMELDQAKEFMSLMDQGHGAKERSQSAMKITYRCASCQAEVARIDHHLKSRHNLKTFTAGKKIIYLSISWLVYMSVPICSFAFSSHPYTSRLFFTQSLSLCSCTFLLQNTRK